MLIYQVYAFISYLFSVIDGKVLRRVFTTVAMALVALVAVGLVSAQLMGVITWSGRSLTLLDPTYASKYVYVSVCFIGSWINSIG